MDGRGSGAEGDGFSVFGNPLLAIGYKALAVGGSIMVPKIRTAV